ncbi:hypothetical protein ABLG96_05585 [Nakamurella sp. A5-74]|uniref:Uncharacterized protein n=1 Tax=Nakamurella sp. A5-74 TaxID=3158264 RepID=A0AAU8DS01_9ACTN
MTTPGNTPRRGFLANLSKAMAPPIIEDDDPSVPLVRPRAILIAAILVGIAAVMFLFNGVGTLVTIESNLAKAEQAYPTQLIEIQKQCAPYGGIGAAATAPQGAADDVVKTVQSCQQVQPSVTNEMRDNFRSSQRTPSLVVTVMGLIAAAAGFFLFRGVPWARRLLVGLVIITMLVTMLLQISNVFTLIATLFIVVSVLMSYLGKGGVFFAKALLRQKAAR